MTHFDRTKVEELLTALWQSKEKDIQSFIARNDDSRHYYVDYYCMKARLIPKCEDCAMKDYISCTHNEVLCYCAQELEVLPLDVHDTEQFRRICINFYVGACPHVLCLIENRLDSLNLDFLQDKMEASYNTVDLTHKVTLVKSHYTTMRDLWDLFFRVGSYTEHFLIRLGKIQYLMSFLTDHILAKEGLRVTFYCWYTVLHLSILNMKTDFLLAVLKQKNMKKQRNLDDILSNRVCNYENTILYIAMERDLLHVMIQILKMICKIHRKGAHDEYHLALKTTLWGSIAKAKVECLKILLRSGLILFDYSREEEEAVDIDRIQSFSSLVQNNNLDILDLLLDCPGFHTYLMELLPFTALYGNVEMCEKILKRYSKYYNKESRQHVDVYTLAVLQNYPEVLKVLLSYSVPPFQHGNFTALDFARSFQREKCSDILRRVNHDCLEFTTDISPLLEVQKLDHMTCKLTLSFVKLVEELVHIGFNVNFEDPNGITAVQMAIKRQDYDTVRVMLQNGADLFRGQSFMLQHGTLRLVTEVIHCNVDVCDHLSTILEIASRYIRYPRHRVEITVRTDSEKVIYSFISNSLHSLSPRDRRDIVKYYKEYDLLCVRSLQELSRIKLRRHYGWHIHKFVDLVTIPKSLKRFILLADAIEAFKKDIIL